MSTKITHIIFDIDGTLIDESESLMLQTSAVAWKFGETLEAKQAVVDQFFAANDRAVAEGGQYKNDITQYMRWIGEALGISVSDSEAAQLAHDWKEAFSGTFSAPILFPDAAPCLDTLRTKGVTLVVASGGTVEKKRGLIVEAGLSSYFDTLYAATDVGFQKQDRRFWDYVLDELEVTPENIMVVGNQINDDIMHPKSLGMQTVLVKRPGLLHKDLGPKDIQANHTIENLDELVQLVH
jgi:FMN phosphatase YigB (HAD superfamily)